MIKFFILEKTGDKPNCLLLQLILEDEKRIGGLFQKIETKYFKGLIEIVDRPEDADYFFLPINFFSISNNKNYINKIEQFSEKFKKKIVVFAYGDSSEEIKVKNSIVLRTSKYKSELKNNEIIIPAFVEDLGLENGFEPRSLDSRKPVVGFAGWVACSNMFQWIKYLSRLVIQFIALKFKLLKSSSVYQGIYFRRRAVSILKNSQKVKTNFFLRSSYSGHKNTIEDDPEIIRKQFISSIKDSDLALAIKGDGNYSLRFFEILSLGRIPLFIDTDSPLPLEHEIDYDQFTLRVDYKDINNLPRIINDFWSKMTPKRFIEMQNNARKAFEYRLSAPAFYRYLFDNFDDIVKAHEGDIR